MNTLYYKNISCWHNKTSCSVASNICLTIWCCDCKPTEISLVQKCTGPINVYLEASKQGNIISNIHNRGLIYDHVEFLPGKTNSNNQTIAIQRVNLFPTTDFYPIIQLNGVNMTLSIREDNLQQR